MNLDKFEVIETHNLTIIFSDFTDQSEEEILGLLENSSKIGLSSKNYFGSIICMRGAFATPRIRQTAKALSLKSQETDRYVGAVLFGVNDFIKMVAKMANSKVVFGKNKEDCIHIMHEMLEGKRPSYLPSS